MYYWAEGEIEMLCVLYICLLVLPLLPSALNYWHMEHVIKYQQQKKQLCLALLNTRKWFHEPMLHHFTSVMLLNCSRFCLFVFLYLIIKELNKGKELIKYFFFHKTQTFFALNWNSWSFWYLISYMSHNA